MTWRCVPTPFQIVLWLAQVTLTNIQGMENTSAEFFRGSRDYILGYLEPLRQAHVVLKARARTAAWLHCYNQHLPYEALGSVPPVEYRVTKFPNLYF